MLLDFIVTNMASLSNAQIGFVGLGAMGWWQAKNLAEKLPPGAHIYAFDVVEKPVDELVSRYPERFTKKASAKDVAEKSVPFPAQITAVATGAS